MIPKPPMVMTAAHPSLIEAAVGLGSNLGDRLANLRAARDCMDALRGVRLLDCSPVYETEPVDVPEAYREQCFLNAVLIFETNLSPGAWSDALHAIEDTLLRVRTGERNAPRTIDIDLLTYGDLVHARSDLTLPHPQCVHRRFVCQPFCDVRPGQILPGQTRTMLEILDTLPSTPAVRRFTQRW